MCPMSMGDALLEMKVEDQEFISDLQGIENKLKASADKMQNIMKKASIGMIAAGTAILTGLGMAAKAAEDERVGVARLKNAMENVGIAYDEVSDSLEEQIALLQRKTGIADDQQRESMAQLIRVTRDYDEALDLMQLSMDVAAGKGWELEEATKKLMYALSGNWGEIEQYIPALKQATTEEEKWALLRSNFAGAAEDTASGWDKIKNSVSDLTESIGDSLLPVINNLLENHLVPLVDKITEWVKANPDLVEAVGILAGVLLAGGGIIAAMLLLSKAITAVNAAMIIMQSLSGIGLVKVLAGLAVAAGAIYGMNKLLQSAGPDIDMPETPSMDSGGVVPGPLGSPQLIMARGGEEYLGVGANRRTAGGLTVNFGNYMGDDMSRRFLISELKEFFREEEHRSVYAPNRTEPRGNKI